MKEPESGRYSAWLLRYGFTNSRGNGSRFIFTCVNLEQHQSIFGTRYQSCDRIITPAFLDIVYLIT